MQPPERGATPSEGVEGDEWAAYVTLLRTTETNAGSPTGREPHGDGGLVVVAGVTTGQGGRESRLHGRRRPGDGAFNDREVCVMQNAETVLGVLRERLTQQSLESRMIGKPSRPVRREAARKRT